MLADLTRPRPFPGNGPRGCPPLMCSRFWRYRKKGALQTAVAENAETEAPACFGQQIGKCILKTRPNCNVAYMSSMMSLRNTQLEFNVRYYLWATMWIDAMNRAGRKVAFLSKRKLLNITAQRFQSAFGIRCVESGREETGDSRLEFHIKCSGGWIISTHFWFGRGERLLDYPDSLKFLQGYWRGLRMTKSHR